MASKPFTWFDLRTTAVAVDVMPALSAQTGLIPMPVDIKSLGLMGLFSDAGATATVQVFGFPAGSLEGTFLAEVTLTALGYRMTANGLFGSAVELVALKGLERVYVYITALSAGSIAIRGIGLREQISANASAAAKSLADVNAAVLALRSAKTLDDIVTAISGILKSEMVTAKAAAWAAITTDTAFTPPAGTNGLTLSPKATSSGDTVSVTVWGKPSGASEQYRIVEAFSFTCSTATLDADGFTAAFKNIDITGLTDIKVIFTGGTLDYIPF